VSAGPFACGCRNFPPGDADCATRATQEDGLCDDCRAGCTMAVGLDEGKARHLAARVEAFGITISPAAHR
jgi:hypothetical protein